MGAATDHLALEQEYVTGDLSIRALARDHGLSSYSALARKAREGGWYQKRDSYRLTLANKTYDLMADTGAVENAKRNEKMLRVALKGLDAFEKDLNAGRVAVSARDAVALIGVVRLLTGESTERKEERHLGLNLSGPITPDLLRSLEQRARSGLEDTGGMEADPRVVSPAAGTG